MPNESDRHILFLFIADTREAVDALEQDALASRSANSRAQHELARLGQVHETVRRRANAAVDRGLRIDPVNRTLLDLRRTIDENWIRRRVSDLTNAESR